MMLSIENVVNDVAGVCVSMEPFPAIPRDTLHTLCTLSRDLMGPFGPHGALRVP